MTVEPSALRENFTAQFNTAVEEIKKLEAEVLTKKELALKLKGAIEALDLLEQPNTVTTEGEATFEVIPEDELDNIPA
tara:strand:+ start:2058 stop:2291 length:234 start_codon:yes stop_codon:yes gene_type:complete